MRANYYFTRNTSMQQPLAFSNKANNFLSQPNLSLYYEMIYYEMIFPLFGNKYSSHRSEVNIIHFPATLSKQFINSYSLRESNTKIIFSFAFYYTKIYLSHITEQVILSKKKSCMNV